MKIDSEKRFEEYRAALQREILRLISIIKLYKYINERTKDAAWILSNRANALGK